MKKRMLTLLLCIVMCACLMSVAVFAEDVSENIILTEDTAMDVVIAEGANVTLDLNGYTLTNVSSHTILNKGTLKVIDSSAEKTGKVDNITHQKAAIYNIGVATLDEGTYVRSKEAGKDANTNGENSYYTILNHGTMTVNSGVKVYNNGHFSSLLDNGYYNWKAQDGIENPTLTINGGVFDGGLNTLKNDDNAILEVNGGIFKNYTQAALQNHNVAKITGGVFDAADVYAVSNCGCDVEGGHDVGKLEITGGTFNGDVARATGDKGIITITGGTFSSDPTVFIPEGYKVTATNGNYVVSEKTQQDYMNEIAVEIATTTVKNVFKGFKTVAGVIKSYIPSYLGK